VFPLLLRYIKEDCVMGMLIIRCSRTVKRNIAPSLCFFFRKRALQCTSLREVKKKVTHPVEAARRVAIGQQQAAHWLGRWSLEFCAKRLNNFATREMRPN
jgi:hypothetical protein